MAIDWACFNNRGQFLIMPPIPPYLPHTHSSREVKVAGFPHAEYAKSHAVRGLTLDNYAMVVLDDILYVHGGNVSWQDGSIGALLAYHLDSDR